MKQDIEKRTFTVPVKVGQQGQIFGGVREKDVLEVLNKKLSAHFQKQDLTLSAHIKELGHHTGTLSLGHGIKATINIHLEAQQ
jgi:large subunit ribosomal protein L9